MQKGSFYPMKNDFDFMIIEKKIILADAATQVFINPDLEFTVANISETAGLNMSDFFECFPNKKAALHYWYQSIPIRYELMLADIDGYEDLTLAEKLSNFLYVAFSIFDENRAFVEKTYDELVFVNQDWHPLRKETAGLLKSIIENHNGVSNSARVVLFDEVFDFMAKETLHVYKFWTKDKSEGYERSMALADKFSSFAAELLCNKVIDSGIDLARFFWNEGIIKVDINIPFVGRIKSGS